MLVADKDKLKEEIAAHVMKIVNKHHADTKKNLAVYRTDIRRIESDFDSYQRKINNALGKFNDKHENLPSKLQSIESSICSHAQGVQNVYNEMIEIKKLFNDEHIQSTVNLLKSLSPVEVQKILLRLDGTKVAKALTEFKKVAAMIEEMHERISF